MSSLKRPPSLNSSPEQDDSKKQKKSILDHFKPRSSNQSSELSSDMDQNEKFESLMNRTAVLLSEWENFQTMINSQFKDLHEKQNEMNVTSKLSYEKSYQNEQYQRNYNVRIYGMSDDKNETAEKCEEKVLKMFEEKLKIKVSSADIDIAHRIPKFNKTGEENESPRTVICRFVHKKTKNLVIKNRSKLKRKEGDANCIVIKEDLTKYHQQLLAKCIDRFDTAWARDGRIFAKETPDSNPKEIKSMSDIGTSWVMSDNYERPNHPTSKSLRGSGRGRGSRSQRSRGGGRGVWRGGHSSPPVGRHSESTLESDVTENAATASASATSASQVREDSSQGDMSEGEIE